MSTPEPVEIHADLCRVTREGDDVVIHFGQAAQADGLDGALRATPCGRIAMPESGGVRLLDLLSELLRQPAPGEPPRR